MSDKKIKSEVILHTYSFGKITAFNVNLLQIMSLHVSYPSIIVQRTIQPICALLNITENENRLHFYSNVLEVESYSRMKSENKEFIAELKEINYLSIIVRSILRH